MRSFNNARGFSLLETGLTLTIGGLIIGLLWIAASTIQENERKTKLAEQTAHIITNTRRVFGNAGAAPNITGAGGTTEAAIRAGIFPPDMLVAGNNTPRDVYRGEVLLSHNATTTPPTFRLSMDRITPGGCVALLSKMVRDATVRRQYGIVGALSSANLEMMPAGNELGNGDLPANRITQLCGGGPFSARSAPQQVAVHLDFRYY